MPEEKNRYFIELQMDGVLEIPRNREAEMRRAQAAQFVDQIAEWLHEQDLDSKVASMAITALGQVQITCADDVINRIRDDESLQIATIRQSTTVAESINRVMGW